MEKISLKAWVISLVITIGVILFFCNPILR